MELFRQAVNDWVEVAWKHRIADKSLHFLAYTNSLQDAMDWAIQIVKTELKLNPNKKPESKILMISYKDMLT